MKVVEKFDPKNPKMYDFETPCQWCKRVYDPNELTCMHCHEFVSEMG